MIIMKRATIFTCCMQSMVMTLKVMCRSSIRFPHTQRVMNRLQTDAKRNEAEQLIDHLRQVLRLDQKFTLQKRHYENFKKVIQVSVSFYD